MVKSKKLTINIDEKMMKKLEKNAKAEKKSIAELIRLAIDAMI